MLENNATRTRVFETNISLLDALLKDGGIVLPDNPDNPGISVLLKGPAGAGKSTLSMLMAAKCAQDGGPALYCALEQSGYSLKRLSRCLDVDESGWHWTEEVEPEPEEKPIKMRESFTSLVFKAPKHVKGTSGIIWTSWQSKQTAY